MAALQHHTSQYSSVIRSGVGQKLHLHSLPAKKGRKAERGEQEGAGLWSASSLIAALSRSIPAHGLGFVLHGCDEGVWWTQVMVRGFKVLVERCHPSILELYNKASLLTAISWAIYPVVFIFSEGTGDWSPNFEVRPFFSQLGGASLPVPPSCV